MSSQISGISERALALWIEQEKVAMHFNDLIMRWRLQAVGGMVALVTAAGWVISNTDTPGERYRGMFLLALTLLSAWIAVAQIDLWYYRNLLKGAVKSILALEAQVPGIELSQRIEKVAEKAGFWAPIWFYAIGGIPLLAILIWAASQLIVLPPAVLDPAPPVIQYYPPPRLIPIFSDALTPR